MLRLEIHASRGACTMRGAKLEYENVDPPANETEL
jgi:hypothetical protein